MTMGGQAVRTAAATMLALALFFTSGCGAQTTSPTGADAESTEQAAANPGELVGTPSEEGAETQDDQPSADEEYEKALSARGLVTGFIGEQFYDGTIKDANDALAAAQSVITRVGGDKTTKLESQDIMESDTGNTYYVLRQQAGDVAVHGASVKVIVDKDGKAVGLVSAILPNVQLDDLESWEVTKEQAEQAVLDECKADGVSDAKVISDATEQTLISISDNTDRQRYAWVVYTDNYLEGYDAAYLAHYVSADGDYLYALPVSEPNDQDALAGDKVTFEFDKMEQGEWSGTVTKRDGSTMKVTVPTLTNPATGEVLLGDAKRKILCVDYADFTYNETISPRVMQDNKFADNEVIVYDTFIRVWDHYNEAGWTGPDGIGTPTIIKMDYVDQSGQPVHNACYDGRNWGFQTFAFNRDESDGECLDVVGHEFTHCVTATTMTTNLYMNDPGAINEGFSDVMGNLIEMISVKDDKGAWLFGENLGQPLRSLKNPHEYNQPEFVWDAFYGPAAAEPTEANDRGGVHTNSSLLNFLSYKLDQAGMSPSDQFTFWFDVAAAMTPSTDYPQLAELLPWCMERTGFSKYVDAIKSAIKEGRLAETTMPDKLPENIGTARAKLPEKPLADVNEMVFEFPLTSNLDASAASSWVGANADELTVNLPAGDYYALLQLTDKTPPQVFALTEEGWVAVTEGMPENIKTVTVAAGETAELSSQGLEE